MLTMPEESKAGAIRNLLLGPLLIVGELIGGLIPGVLFVLLLVVKRVPEATGH
jgi:hypothetical protein